MTLHDPEVGHVSKLLWSYQLSDSPEMVSNDPHTAYRPFTPEVLDVIETTTSIRVITRVEVSGTDRNGEYVTATYTRPCPERRRSLSWDNMPIWVRLAVADLEDSS